MKKLIIIGLAVILAFALVTCGFAPNSIEGGDEFAEYSADGRTVTINLNGGGRSSMPRALTNALARLNHDYYEVVFFYDGDGPSATTATQQIARTSWERGEGAALSVFRGKDGNIGINYGSVDFEGSIEGASGAVDIGAAILFVGKRTPRGAVLLGVGTLTGTTETVGTAVTTTTAGIVKSVTTKVTFEIVTLASAIKPVFPLVATNSSFFTIRDDTDGSFNFTADAGTIDVTSTTDTSKGTGFGIQMLNDSPFPLFVLQSNPATTITENTYAAKFTFTTASGAVTAPTTPHTIAEYVKGIVVAGAPAVPAAYQYIEMGPPATIINGEKVSYNTQVLGVDVTMENNKTADATLNNEAYFLIKVPGQLEGGLITFTFTIPVYAITKAPASGNGIEPKLWFIQPGLEKNYIDNGTNLGGSILFGIGDPGKLEIGTGFMPFTP